MGKTCVISIVLPMVLCHAAQAHRPIFSEKAATDPNTAVMISQPAISQVIYREITKVSNSHSQPDWPTAWTWKFRTAC